MKKFLSLLADKPTPQWTDVVLMLPEPVRRYLDRYMRQGRHDDVRGAVSGYALVEQCRQWRIEQARLRLATA